MRKFIHMVLLALTIFITYLIVHGLGLDKNVRLIEITMAGIVSYFAFLCYLEYKKEKTDYTKLIQWILCMGFVMRIGYMLYTGCQTRVYDLGDITPDGYGHAAYILKLLLDHKLPDTNEIQFYHPPLFYFLGAAVSKLTNIFLGQTDHYDLVDASKLVSCFASCGMLILCREFCRFLKLKAKQECLVMLLLAFFPNFILLAGRVNNDALVTFFMTGAVLYTYIWTQQPTYKNTIILALYFGLGMMTKISCSVIAVFTFVIMCRILFKSIQDKQFKSYLGKYIVFGLISLPLGLWYPIRNYLLFKQPLNYVLPIPIESQLYRGNVPYFQRLISGCIGNLWATPFADPWADQNMPAYIAKSSLFGEFAYNVPLFIPIILLLINVLLIAFSLFAAYLVLAKKEQSDPLYRRLVYLGGLILVFYLYFNLRYPFGCSMDFRYIPITAILGCLLSAFAYGWPIESFHEDVPWLSSIFKLYQFLFPTLVILFSLLSLMFFTLMTE